MLYLRLQIPKPYQNQILNNKRLNLLPQVRFHRSLHAIFRRIPNALECDSLSQRERICTNPSIGAIPPPTEIETIPPLSPYANIFASIYARPSLNNIHACTFYAVQDPILPFRYYPVTHVITPKLFPSIQYLVSRGFDDSKAPMTIGSPNL